MKILRITYKDSETGNASISRHEYMLNDNATSATLVGYLDAATQAEIIEAEEVHIVSTADMDYTGLIDSEVEIKAKFSFNVTGARNQLSISIPAYNRVAMISRSDLVDLENTDVVAFTDFMSANFVTRYGQSLGPVSRGIEYYGKKAGRKK